MNLPFDCSTRQCERPPRRAANEGSRNQNKMPRSHVSKNRRRSSNGSHEGRRGHGGVAGSHGYGDRDQGGGRRDGRGEGGFSDGAGAGEVCDGRCLGRIWDCRGSVRVQDAERSWLAFFCCIAYGQPGGVARETHSLITWTTPFCVKTSASSILALLTYS